MSRLPVQRPEWRVEVLKEELRPEALALRREEVRIGLPTPAEVEKRT